MLQFELLTSTQKPSQASHSVCGSYRRLAEVPPFECKFIIFDKNINHLKYKSWLPEALPSLRHIDLAHFQHNTHRVPA